MKPRIFASSLLLLCFLLCSKVSIAAEQVLEVIRQTNVLRDANTTAAKAFKVESGRKVFSDGTEKNGFLKLQSKSGAGLWISKSDVKRLESNDDSDLAAPEAAEAKSGPRFSWDLSGATSRTNDQSNLEIQAGLNYHINSWLLFRNAPFYRFTQGASDSYFGLDSSLQGVKVFSLADTVRAGFRAGAGYRIVNDASDAPFLETGLSFQLGGLQLAAGVKYLLNSVMNENAENETLFTLGFSGSGSGVF